MIKIAAKKTFVTILLLFVLVIAMGGCAEKNGQEKNDGVGNSLSDQFAQVLLQNNPEPIVGSIGGDWIAFGLGRWSGEVPQEWLDAYYAQMEQTVIACQGVLHERKYTEYSRVILALTAIGKDPSDVAGYNLLTPLADFEKTVFQGVNGPAYALLALDSAAYEMPVLEEEGIQASRELYVDHILECESEGGGWALAGGPAEVDLTAMVLQALAKYQERQDVAEAIDRALVVLSDLQCSSGGFIAYEEESCESVAQVIVALTELGIDVEDSRFVKDGNTLETCLFGFMTQEGGFSHVPSGAADAMATEQAFYALVAMERADKGQSSLYDMAEGKE